jgi:hypothetical protein
MKRIFNIILLTALAACIPVAPTPIETEAPNPSSTAAPTHTPTIVWFPSTSTPSPFPTVMYTPTPDLLPSLGAILLEDDFNEPVQWSLVESTSSSVTIANQHLTMAISEPKAFLFTTRHQPVFDDFYAEISATTSLCMGADEYGMLIRVSPALEYYRFSLSCDGRSRVDRIYGGLATTVVPWTENGVIPTTVPSSTRLGVWASGDEIRFFINGFYLFSVRDTVLWSGTLGLFARSAGETGVSVSFTDLVVHQVAE